MICNAHVASIQEVLRFGIYLIRDPLINTCGPQSKSTSVMNEEFDPLVPISIPVT